MLTSIATIAAALTAVIGLGYKVYAGFKAAKQKKHEEEGRTLEKRILEATTPAERAEHVRLLDIHNSK